MAFHVFAAGEYDPESPLVTQFFSDLIGNFSGLANGDSGAPSIIQAALGSGSVGQGELKIGGPTQVNQNSVGSSNVVLSGGQYNFYPEIANSAAASGTEVKMGFAFNSATFIDNIWLSYTSGSGSVSARTVYVNASPPYDLGDGVIHLFVYVTLYDGIPSVIWTSPDPQWMHNGPTDNTPDGHRYDRAKSEFVGYKKIRLVETEHVNVWDEVRKLRKLDDNVSADSLIDRMMTDEMVTVDIDQTRKNADMNLVPSPIIETQPYNVVSTVKTIMLDPVSPFMEKLCLINEQGGSYETVSDLITTNRIKISNTQLTRNGPEGIEVYGFSM